MKRNLYIYRGESYVAESQDYCTVTLKHVENGKLVRFRKLGLEKFTEGQLKYLESMCKVDNIWNLPSIDSVALKQSFNNRRGI